MKQIQLILICILVATTLFAGRGNNHICPDGKLPIADTGRLPHSNQASDEDKVAIGDSTSRLEITPASSIIPGVLIEGVNLAENKGVNTSFFLKDTSSWTFYTNAQRRLTISGTGNVDIHSPVTIAGPISPGSTLLNVRGSARVDSAFYLRAAFDSNSFVSMHRQAKHINDEPDDSLSPFTITPTAWSVSAGVNIPVFRLRHPVANPRIATNNTSVQRDFMILPYEFGMAIEYSGVVECWVGEWSIHKSVFYDPEGTGNGWGAVFWVGDDGDRGGVRATARNNIEFGGNVNYGELSVERFAGDPNGDFRFRLPSVQNNFQFLYGGRGSNNIIATIKNEGLVIPKIASAANAQAPEKAQLVFDSTDNSFKGFNGNQWVNLGETKLYTGSFSTSSTGLDLVYAIPHGLGREPAYFNVIATSIAAANVGYVTANANFILVWYTSPPPFGENNLSWNWQAR